MEGAEDEPVTQAGPCPLLRPESGVGECLPSPLALGGCHPWSPGRLKEKQFSPLLSPPIPSRAKNTIYGKQKGPILVYHRGLCLGEVTEPSVNCSLTN